MRFACGTVLSVLFVLGLAASVGCAPISPSKTDGPRHRLAVSPPADTATETTTSLATGTETKTSATDPATATAPTSGTTAAPQPPAAPASLTAQGSDGSVTLAWPAVIGATTYNLYYGTSPAVSVASGTKVSIGASTGFVLAALANGATYSFVVTALDADHRESAASTVAAATPLALLAPPTGLMVNGGDRSSTLTWTPVADAAGYVIYFGADPSLTTTSGTRLVAGNVTTYKHTGLTNYGVYSYLVTALNANGAEGAASAVQLGVPQIVTGGSGAPLPALPNGTVTATSSLCLFQPNCYASAANAGAASAVQTGVNSPYTFGAYPDPNDSGKIKFLVVDRSNQRVLIFNNMPTSSAAQADVVVGQADFTHNGLNAGGVTSAYGYSTPNQAAICTNGALFVADKGNNRVLGYSKVPTASGAAADFVLGQPDFATLGAAVTFNTADPSISWPVDTTLGVNAPVSFTGATMPTGITALTTYYVTSVTGCSGSGACTAVVSLAKAGSPVQVTTAGSGVVGAAVTARSMNQPYGVSCLNNSLYVADRGNNRMMVFSPIPTTSNVAAATIIGQPDALTIQGDSVVLDASTHYVTWPAGTTLATGAGVYFNATTMPTGLTSAKVYYVTNPSTCSGSPCAQLALSTVNAQAGTAIIFTTGGSTVIGKFITASTLNQPYEVATDGTALYLADGSNHRVLVYDPLPTASGAAATYVIGQANMVSGSSNQGATLAAIGGHGLILPEGLAIQAGPSGTYLAVDDNNNNNRILFFPLPVTQSDPAATYEWGQWTAAVTATIGVTITATSPAVVTWPAGTSLVIGSAVHFTATAVPAGLTANTTYFATTVTGCAGGSCTTTLATTLAGAQGGTANVNATTTGNTIIGYRDATFTNATPTVVTWPTDTPLVVGQAVSFTNGPAPGAMPAGITAGTTYYVTGPTGCSGAGACTTQLATTAANAQAPVPTAKAATSTGGALLGTISGLSASPLTASLTLSNPSFMTPLTYRSGRGIIFAGAAMWIIDNVGNRVMAVQLPYSP